MFFWSVMLCLFLLILSLIAQFQCYFALQNIELIRKASPSTADNDGDDSDTAEPGSKRHILRLEGFQRAKTSGVGWISGCSNDCTVWSNIDWTTLEGGVLSKREVHVTDDFFCRCIDE